MDIRLLGCAALYIGIGLIILSLIIGKIILGVYSSGFLTISVWVTIIGAILWFFGRAFHDK